MAGSGQKLSLCTISTRPDLIDSCSALLLDIWPWCKTGRLSRLAAEEGSDLPCSLVLIEHRDNSPDQVIGHGRLVTVTYPERPRVAYIEAVCIHKSRQGQGLGTKLMLMVENYAAKILKCEHFFLISNDSTKTFYERLGFQRFPAFTFETEGANLLAHFQLVSSWYGNTPRVGWESAYDYGSYATKDDLVKPVFSQVTMRKSL